MDKLPEVPASLSAMAEEGASADDQKLAAHLALCAELAASGPGAFRRRGVTVGAPKPWNPPDKVEFEHPALGKLRASVATGTVEKVEVSEKLDGYPHGK